MDLIRLLLVLAALVCSAEAVAFATIGPQANCTYTAATPNPIQTALNAGHTDIRLVGGQTLTGSIVVAGNADVSIRGGFADCAGAANGSLPTVPVRTQLEPGAAGSAAVILVESAVRRRNILLEQLWIRPNPALGSTGSGIAVGGALDAILLRSRVSGFRSGGDGGGVVVSLGRLQLIRSSLDDNRARDGGGVHCVSGEINLDFASVLRLNEASRNGGGAYLQQCLWISNGRNIPGTQGGPAGVLDNRAAGRGGGLYQRGGFATFAGGPLCTVNPGSACPGQLALMSGNRAEVAGGAAFLTAQAEMDAHFVQIANNSATISGGALHLEQQSQLRIGGLAPQFPAYDRSSCLNRICDAIFSNRLGAADSSFLSGEGGAFFVQDATLSGKDLFLTDHNALSGTVLAARGGAAVNLDQILLVQAPRQANDNGRDVLLISDSADLDLRRSTLYGQRSDERQLIRLDLAGELRLHQSVLAAIASGLQELLAGPAAQISGSCNGKARSTHPVFDGPTVSAADFEADYSPSSSSLLIDRCNSNGAGSRDIRGESRVVLVHPPASATPLDLGAFERPSGIVYANGFE